MKTRLDNAFFKQFTTLVAPNLELIGLGMEGHAREEGLKQLKKLAKYPVEEALEVVGTPFLKTINLARY